MDVVPCQSIPGTSPCLTQSGGTRGWLRVNKLPQMAPVPGDGRSWMLMSHQLHERKPELIASRLECPLLRPGMTERPPDAPRAQLPTAVSCWEAARKSRQTVVLGARGRAVKCYQ